MLILSIFAGLSLPNLLQLKYRQELKSDMNKIYNALRETQLGADRKSQDSFLTIKNNKIFGDSLLENYQLSDHVLISDNTLFYNFTGALFFPSHSQKIIITSSKSNQSYCIILSYVIINKGWYDGNSCILLNNNYD